MSKQVSALSDEQKEQLKREIQERILVAENALSEMDVSPDAQRAAYESALAGLSFVIEELQTAKLAMNTTR